MQLFGTQFHLRAVPRSRPEKFALMQSARRQPDAQPIVHQHFHAIGAAVGKQISTVRLRRTEHGHHPRQRCVSAGAHVHGLSGEPDGVDTNHRNRSRRKVAQAAALSVGQFTLTVPRGCWISTLIVDDADCDSVLASGMGSETKAGCSAMLFCVCSRIHLWTRFALRLWLSATLAIEAPGWAHS
uniref:Putative accesory protein n=1 Tax=Pseudomonas aeruginosa TaxID=287 RepID=A0A7L9EMK5_PSEAI|nr:putative accesory protein [Pseudomonas aeruginosa]